MMNFICFKALFWLYKENKHNVPDTILPLKTYSTCKTTFHQIIDLPMTLPTHPRINQNVKMQKILHSKIIYYNPSCTNSEEKVCVCV